MAAEQTALNVVLQPTGPEQAAPHGEGNIYAPDVMLDNGRYRMWFGAQGRDGHDRILLAESPDGHEWKSLGVVLDNGDANHVNDPSVVKVGDKYYMYYTRAVRDVNDDIALAISDDGFHWTQRGVVLGPSAPGMWDSLLVGRPSVLVVEGKFRMWYDGRSDLPLGAPARNVPKSPTSTRSVGYAESSDGIHWKRPLRAPVFANDAGGVHVARIGKGYVMVYEGHTGTQFATSDDGLTWKAEGLLAGPSGTDADRHGHVTPFLYADEPGKPVALYIGAASAASWDRNVIARIEQNELLHPLASHVGPGR